MKVAHAQQQLASLCWVHKVTGILCSARHNTQYCWLLRWEMQWRSGSLERGSNATAYTYLSSIDLCQSSMTLLPDRLILIGSSQLQMEHVASATKIHCMCWNGPSAGMTD